MHSSKCQKMHLYYEIGVDLLGSETRVKDEKACVAFWWTLHSRLFRYRYWYVWSYRATSDRINSKGCRGAGVWRRLEIALAPRITLNFSTYLVGSVIWDFSGLENERYVFIDVFFFFKQETE